MLCCEAASLFCVQEARVAHCVTKEDPFLFVASWFAVTPLPRTQPLGECREELAAHASVALLRGLLDKSAVEAG